MVFVQIDFSFSARSQVARDGVNLQSAQRSSAAHASPERSSSLAAESFAKQSSSKEHSEHKMNRDSGATASTSSAASSEPSPSPPQPPPPQPSPLPPPESCVKYFDALWFCYSPGHQLKQFYRYGNVDDCTGAWSQLWACLSKRTVRFAPREGDESSGHVKEHPLWKLQTKEEAKAAWDAEFGHLDGGGGGGGAGEAKEGGEARGGGKGGGKGGGLHAEAGEAIP
jgi:hypothetical protein